jgi:hypothetical protein
MHDTLGLRDQSMCPRTFTLAPLLPLAGAAAPLPFWLLTSARTPARSCRTLSSAASFSTRRSSSRSSMSSRYSL